MTDRVDSSRLLGVLRDIAGVLDAERVSWALVGGLAVSIRAEPRFTRDIDLAVAAADDAAAEALVAGLQAAGYRLRLALEHDRLKRLATVRLTPPSESEEGIVLDLLFASSGIESEICLEAERVDVSVGVTVPVARTGHLVATKLLAVAPDRPQDGVDLYALRRHLTPEERERARRAVLRIDQIGASRGKNLSGDFTRWLGTSDEGS